MSILLRGKKTALKNYTENFTKVPNLILHANGLSPVDKLILIELQSYATRPEYVLAYTRLAQDLKIDKSNLIARWKSLQAKGYITVTANDRWSINYTLLESQVVSPLLESQVGLTHQPTKQGSVTPPSSGRSTLPTQVGSPLLSGSVNPPIEEDNKEEDKEIKNKEEDKAPIEVTNINNTSMIKKEELIREIKERELKAQSIDGIVTIYKNKPEYGAQFKVGDYNSMMKYVLDIPSVIKTDSNTSIENNPSIEPSEISYNNTSIKKQPDTTQQKKEPINEIKAYSSINEFISTLSTERIKKYASMNRTELYRLLNNRFEFGSIDVFEVINSIKGHPSVEKKIIQSTSPLDFENQFSVTAGDISQSIEVLAAKGGESSALLDEKLLEKVSFVISDLLQYDLIKTKRMIPTVDLLKGLTLNSTEKEIRNHVYEACK